MSTGKKRGRPAGPVARKTVSLRLSQHAIGFFVARAREQTAADLDRGRPVGHTELMRQVLEKYARDGGDE